MEIGQPATTPYSEITKLVAGYYQPIPSEIVQRYKFNTRVRASGELIATYVAALRELSEYCNYGDKLHEMLRDRLVCGVNHDTIQRKLLAETDLTYEKAYTLAQAIEASERERDTSTSRAAKIAVLHCCLCQESITPEHLNILKARFPPREETQPATGVEVHI